MGALHEGHLSLIREARKRADLSVVSIFVNPTQFSPGEDFESYPRTLDSDLEACRRAGADLVFSPSPQDMYPQPQSTSIHVAGLTDGLCGPFRPGHFDGVATVVAKLFNVIPAEVAFFGEKDYQQLMVIRRMAANLNFPIEIVGCPTVREPDGMAMSSRNAYLSPEQRGQARVLSAALFQAAEDVRRGLRDSASLTGEIRRKILAAGPFRIDYVDVVDAHSLAPLATVDRPARICLAVRLGSCRLIDNVGVDGPVTTR
jgi:pantoate--beta-alanine ligase